MTLEESRDKLIIEIEQAIDGFNSGIPGIQQEIYKQILLALKDLEVKDGIVLNNATNIRLIQSLNQRIEDAVLNDQYLKSVGNFVFAFNTVSNTQAEYFKLIEKGFTPFAALTEVKNLSVESTVNSLTESGISANFISKIQDILQQNITSAVKYSDLVRQMQDYIIGTKDLDGALLKYSKQVTTDSLNQYSATYSKMVSD